MAAYIRRVASVAALCVCSQAWAQRFQTLKEVRHWSSGEVVRVVIELTGEVQFDFDRIQGPDRIYIDLSDTRPSNGRKSFQVPVNNGIVRQIRGALTTPTVTRVVIDLDTDVEFAVGQLANPDRVVVELRARTEIKPARREPAPPGEVTLAPPPPQVTQAPPPPQKAVLRAFRAPRLLPLPVPYNSRVLDPRDVPRFPTTTAIARLERFPGPPPAQDSAAEPFGNRPCPREPAGRCANRRERRQVAHQGVGA